MLRKIIVHKIGNKVNQENLFLSNEVLNLEEDTLEQLSDFFLKAFKTEEQFEFYSDGTLEQNPLYARVKSQFEEGGDFVKFSQDVAQQLYNAAENPRVQQGELFVCLFEPEEGNDTEGRQIGLFKTERKQAFLKVENTENDAYALQKDYGIGLTKVDKAALIYEVFPETGYALHVADHNKNGDEYYWFEDFLKVRPRSNDYFHTQETIGVYRDFIKNQLTTEFEVTKADQADFFNKSKTYFSEKEEFVLEDFEREVLQDDQIIESFNNFKTEYEQQTQLNIAEEFPINSSAVKKNQRFFKSVIKLDKNFHIYIHGDRQKIDVGEDEKGRFYRLYFDHEE